MIVVLGKKAVRNHDDFRGRVRWFRVVRGGPANMFAVQEECDPTRVSFDHEATGLASVACSTFACPRSYTIWSVTVETVREAIEALEWVVRQEDGTPKVIATNWTPRNPTDGDYVPPETLDATLDTVFDAGVPLLASAGNEGAGGEPMAELPASRRAIAIGGWSQATLSSLWPDPHDWVEKESSRGAPGAEPAKPDFLCWFGKYSVADGHPETRVDHGYRDIEGTSMAVGQAAGVLARVRHADPLLGVDAILNRIGHAMVRVREAPNTDNGDACPHSQGRGALHVQRALTNLGP